jgi:hypothetical protein
VEDKLSVSISGVSVSDAASDGSSQSDAELDLIAAYAGAGNFMARAELLSNMRRRIEAAEAASKAALDELQLGTDAKSALEAGKAKEAAAARLCEQAEGILGLSKSEAATIRADAEADAAKTRAAADLALRTATDTLANAQTKLGQAEATHAAAAQREEEAEKLRQRCEKQITAISVAIDKFLQETA